MQNDEKHTVKNFCQAVKFPQDPADAEAYEKGIREEKSISLKGRWKSLATLAALTIVAGGAAIWTFYSRPPSVETSSLEKMVYPLPDKPSIAVLPFDNLSGDFEQEYFSDGIAKEITTALAKIPDLFIMPHRSTFLFKGKPTKIGQVSEELGIRYIVEGSVRKGRNHIRITVHLTDVVEGNRLWTEHFNGSFENVFVFLGKISKKIIAALSVKITSSTEEKVLRWGTKNYSAYDALLHGLAHLNPQTLENTAKALFYFMKAIKIDPNFSRAHNLLNVVYSTMKTREFDKDLGISDSRALAQKHLKLAFKNPNALTYLEAAWSYIRQGQIEEAVNLAKRAVSLAPNDPEANYTMARVLIYEGKPGKAMVFIKKAMRLNPTYPAAYLWWMGVAQFLRWHLEESAVTLEKARKRKPQLSPVFQLAAYAYLGRVKDAEKLKAEYIKIRGWKKIPRIKFIDKWYHYKNKTDRDQLVIGLRKIGFKY